ncbi:DUF2442 domain-containing protein [Sphingomonas sp. Ant20]|uniref:DUF2442 domain-containing protein n=1 Tax=Sphingomonas sp. Ant20 TaxID=104605 RepID=UPI0027415AA5|nr:DUF2442 domain-containing protein [Sphingomonas sp. Ant20]
MFRLGHCASTRTACGSRSRDGRTLGVPLAWFPRLLHATPAQRQDFELSRRGIHWDAIDENISVEGLLAVQGDMTHPANIAA